MKGVLVSEKPIMCEKIIVGEKTIIVKKSAPKQVPFKCYIYCTKEEYDKVFYKDKFMHKVFLYGQARGKVIGEFVCNDIEKLEEHIEEGGLYYTLNSDFNEATQLDNWQLHDYGKGKPLYGWHISDLKIYDKPKKLGEFFHYCGDDPKCDGCPAHYFSNTECGKEDYCCSIVDGCKPLTRPPQAWLYAEEAE